MDRRKKIALTYYYSENWIAGSYYVVNIIKALNSLEDGLKPHLVIVLQNKQGLDLVKEVGYPYISYVNTNNNEDPAFKRYIRKLFIKILKKDYPLQFDLRDVDYIFEGSEEFGFIKNHYYWVHDFQECRIPEFFTEEEAAARSALPKKIGPLKDATLILSSNDALNDFKTFFPGYVCKVKVLRFASSLPDFSAVDVDEQKKIFGINRRYFICSNQFWQHKNHALVLEAIRILKPRGLDFQVIFTGKNYDHRNPGYFERLEAFTRDNELQPWISFLGFIDRKVQLALAKSSIAYIQPSLFEGWSTTVEDAKALNQYVLLSDIPVHREQLDYNVAFFNPRDASDLAEKMEVLIRERPAIQERDYHLNIKTFGADLNNAFSA